MPINTGGGDGEKKKVQGGNERRGEGKERGREEERKEKKGMGKEKRGEDEKGRQRGEEILQCFLSLWLSLKKTSKESVLIRAF